MQNISMELSVGDSIFIGEQLLTVVDIDGEEISFKIEKPTESEWGSDENPDFDQEMPPR